jgi:hypothetical protein
VFTAVVSAGVLSRSHARSSAIAMAEGPRIGVSSGGTGDWWRRRATWPAFSHVSGGWVEGSPSLAKEVPDIALRASRAGGPPCHQSTRGAGTVVAAVAARSLNARPRSVSILMYTSPARTTARSWCALEISTRSTLQSSTRLERTRRLVGMRAQPRCGPPRTLSPCSLRELTLRGLGAEELLI